MAIHFFTPGPRSLLNKFDTKTAQVENKGKIDTWEKLPDGLHYTHTSQQWRQKAFFKPQLQNDRLTFYIIKPQNTNITSVVYGYYHGHLLETFLVHFDRDFSTGAASALPESEDVCS
jgi:hypothetical protein